MAYYKVAYLGRQNLTAWTQAELLLQDLVLDWETQGPGEAKVRTPGQGEKSKMQEKRWAYTLKFRNTWEKLMQEKNKIKYLPQKKWKWQSNQKSI